MITSPNPEVTQEKQFARNGEAPVNHFRAVTKMVISILETSTLARQTAYTPPWEEIVPLCVYFTLTGQN